MVRRVEEESRDQVAQWGWYLGQMDILPGSRLLDIQSGSGGLARLAAPFVGMQGLVVGVEPDPKAVTLAQRRTDPRLGNIVRFVTGAAPRLPFRDNAFDAVTCVEALGEAADPLALLEECRRVCRPAGRILLVQTDWDTQVHQSSQREMTRRIIAAFTDSEPAGWGGRNLWGWFNRFPWTNPRLEVYSHFNSEYAPTRTAWTLTRDFMRDPVLASGLVTPAEYDAWLADLEAQERQGAYFFSINRYVCTGRIPPPTR